MKKLWVCLSVLLLSALVINEDVVHWAMAIKVGGYSVTGGFEEAFEYFTISGYLFFTAFRLVPYVGLGIILAILSKTRFKNYLLPVFIGGLIGILTSIIGESWSVIRPFYTDEHVSSTTAIAFLVIPVIAVVTGAIGAVVAAILYALFRRASRKTKSTDALNSK